MPDPYPDPSQNLTQIQSTVEIDNEISFLRNMVSSLQQREKSLVLQIQEFSNLKAQENSIFQLENQLKVKDVETKLYTLKMESLLSENRSLRAQLLENSRTMVELEEARKQIRVLTNRVQLLREEVELMHNGEEERSKRIKELEEELKQLRLVKARLEDEKLELNRQLELQKVDLRFDPTFHTSKEVC
jgi:chromosome segregation ATPase